MFLLAFGRMPQALGLIVNKVLRFEGTQRELARFMLLAQPGEYDKAG